MTVIKLLIFTIVSLTFISITYAGSRFSDCPTPTNHVKLLGVSVSSCNDTLETACPFKTGKNVSMGLKFTTTEDFDTLKIYVAGIIGKIPIKFKMDSQNVCDYGATCPIKANVENSMRLEFPIRPQYPKISLTVQLQVKTADEEETVLCLRFPAQIVN